MLQERIKNKNASILICGGGQSDKLVFEKLGFKKVTISNFDTRMQEDSYEPYHWKFENMESLSFEDNFGSRSRSRSHSSLRYTA